VQKRKSTSCQRLWEKMKRKKSMKYGEHQEIDTERVQEEGADDGDSRNRIRTRHQRGVESCWNLADQFET